MQFFTIILSELVSTFTSSPILNKERLIRNFPEYKPKPCYQLQHTVYQKVFPTWLKQTRFQRNQKPANVPQLFSEVQVIANQFGIYEGLPGIRDGDH